MAWLSTVDHKRIGILYMVTGLVFFVIGGIEALLIRLQLAVPNSSFFASRHLQHGFHHARHDDDFSRRDAGAFRPGQLHRAAPDRGARHGFPAIECLGFWLVPFGGILLHFSFLAGGAPAVGWFAYAPLSETPYSSHSAWITGRSRSLSSASARSAPISTSSSRSFAAARRT